MAPYKPCCQYAIQSAARLNVSQKNESQIIPQRKCVKETGRAIVLPACYVQVTVGNNWNNCGKSTLPKKDNLTDGGGREHEEGESYKTDMFPLTTEACDGSNRHSVHKTCLLINITGCVTLPFHSTQIRTSGSNWDSYGCFSIFG